MDHAGYYMPTKKKEIVYQEITLLRTCVTFRLMDNFPSFIVELERNDKHTGSTHVKSILMGEDVVCRINPTRNTTILEYVFSSPVTCVIRDKQLNIVPMLEE